MNKTNWLSDREKEAIDVLFKEKKPISEIAQNIVPLNCANVNYINKKKVRNFKTHW